jgi:hypothetical protein
MLIDIPHVSAEAEQRRASLLADAENFRLARLARAARRAVKPPSDPPGRASEAPDRSERNGATRNDEAERRYLVPR